MRVLVVEDNHTNLRLMTYLLRAFGHQTVSATNGEEAVAATEEARPDLILMDIQLPGINGFEVLWKLRQIAGGERPRAGQVLTAGFEAAYRALYQRTPMGGAMMIMPPCSIWLSPATRASCSGGTISDVEA